MKKTLAAVLAAMMALSTATVALALDNDVDGETVTGSFESIESSATRYDLVYGGAKEYALKIWNEDNTNYYLNDLGEALAKDLIKIDVTVTDGRSLLKKAPAVSAKKDKTTGEYFATVKLELKHTYGLEFKDIDDNKDNRAKIDTRVRVTALKDFTEGDLTMKKGDTLSVDELLFIASYSEIAAYGKDMTITAQEVKDNMFIVDGSQLVKELEDRDTETATFYFDETAAFTAKISDAQKNVNVYYSTAVADDYYEEYPEVAFEAIEFKGSPKFLRKGTLTFNAIGDEDTAVYEVTADGLVELEIAEYESTYDVVTVEGINKLTSYLVASEALEVEAEVEADEPAVEEENPNTGAC